MNNVYIANFGKGNWAWPRCLEQSILTVTDDVRIHPFWEKEDRDGYIKETQKHLKLASGDFVPTQVASRWYNLNTILRDTKNDLWFHREKDHLWWTTSLDQSLGKDLIEDANRYGESYEVFILYKACNEWSNTDKSGRKLLWNSIHPKAKDFLFTEGTFQKLSNNNAEYARALINGEDLEKWHERKDWKDKAKQTKKGVVTTFNSRQKTSARMVLTALNTVSQSGSSSINTKKLKNSGFKDKFEFEKYVDEILLQQGQACALSEIPMILDDDEGSAEFRCSLDRIDSNGHYERDNLQIVCNFINRWKGKTDNEDFKILLETIKNSDI